MAAPVFGQYTGYAPRPGGGFDFQLANGGTVAAPPGPEAEAHKKLIDEAAKAQGVPVYQPGAGPMAGGGNVQPPQPAQPTPLFRKPDGSVVYQRPGVNPQDPNAFFERAPARAATKGGLALKTQTERGGFEIDPERAKEIQQTQDDLMQARVAHMQKIEQISQEQQVEFAAQRRQANNEAAVLAHENRVKGEQVAALQARYEAAEKDFLETPERQREAREGNTGRNIIEGIALALGSLGAGLARTPNFAQQTIESIHDREMRAEEAALRVKKEGADSLLGRLKDQMGSLDLAKQAYKAIKSRESALTLESLAARADSEQQKSSLLAMAAQENQKYLEKREALDIGSQGEVTKNLQMIQGSAGSAGGDRPVALDTYKTLTGIAGEQASTNKTMADAANTAKGEAPKPVPAERTTQIAEDASLLALGSKILTNPQAQGDSDTFEAKGSIASKVPLIGSALAPKDFKVYEQDLQNWTNRRIKFLTGAGMAESEAIRIARGEVGENKAVNRIRQGVGSGMDEAATRLKANFATLPPEQQQELFQKLPPNVQNMLKRGSK